MNCRIMRAWEDLPRPEREEYFKTEEDDRQRFMEEDEVVGRHCFTLTARIRSPSKPKSPVPFGDTEQDDTADDANDDDDDNYEGSHDAEVSDSIGDNKIDTVGGTEIAAVPEGKRLPDDKSIKEESPAKKNKADTENSMPEEQGKEAERV